LRPRTLQLTHLTNILQAGNITSLHMHYSYKAATLQNRRSLTCAQALADPVRDRFRKKGSAQWPRTRWPQRHRTIACISSCKSVLEARTCCRQGSR